MLIKFTKIAILLSFVFLLSMNFALPVYAADLKFTPQVTIGDYKTKTEGGPADGYSVSKSTRTIGEYIKQIYKYAIGIVGIVAVIVMMVGGVLWMTAGGNPTQVSSAQQYITGALTGLVLVMFSYVILKTVNPDLVNLKVHSITPIKEVAQDPIGCCEKKLSSNTGGMVNESSCEKGSWKGEEYLYNDENNSCVSNPYGCCYYYALSVGVQNTKILQCVAEQKFSCLKRVSTFYEGKNCKDVEGCPKIGVTGSW